MRPRKSRPKAASVAITAKAARSYLPTGTVGAASTRFTPDRPRSTRLKMFLGLAFGTISTSRLRANTEAVPASSPLSPTTLIWVWLALAKTSAGAPCTIWVARVSEPPKLKRTVTSLALEKVSPMLVKASLSEAAAKTVIEPLSRAGWRIGAACAGMAPNSSRAASGSAKVERRRSAVRIIGFSWLS